jgi:dihydropteroate synthase
LLPDFFVHHVCPLQYNTGTIHRMKNKNPLPNLERAIQRQREPQHELRCGKYVLDLQRPLVMGIVNITPDSFSDGGKFLSRDRAITHARELIAAGADIIDIGGESTRPGADAVSLADELERVLPVLEALVEDGVPISVDTQKPEVMVAAIRAGASMINDVNALQAEGAVEALVQPGAHSKIAICLMHKQGNPLTMQALPRYEDVVEEVHDFLLARASVCEAAGIARERIVIDPGFGFGKTVEHNFALLYGITRLAQAGYPILAGFSRKASLGTITGRPVEQRLAASLAVALLAAQAGARIIRVHDVAETVDVLKVLTAHEMVKP